MEAGSRFFTNIFQRGTLLYCSDVIMPLDGKVLDNDSFLIDVTHLDHRLLLIEGFLAGARECLGNLQYNVRLFMLPQVVEQCCLALIRTHLDYRSGSHNLQRLLQLCSCFSTEPIKVFVSGTKEDGRLFDILLKSCSQTRYSDGFLANKDDVHLLYHRIELFLALTKSMCNRRYFHK